VASSRSARKKPSTSRRRRAGPPGYDRTWSYPTMPSVAETTSPNRIVTSPASGMPPVTAHRIMWRKCGKLFDRSAQIEPRCDAVLHLTGDQNPVWSALRTARHVAGEVQVQIMIHRRGRDVVDHQAHRGGLERQSRHQANRDIRCGHPASTRCYSARSRRPDPVLPEGALKYIPVTGTDPGMCSSV